MKRYINSYTLFITVFFGDLIWIFQGFNVLDSGFHLTNQVLAFDHRFSDSYAVSWFLTDYIGGMWLKVSGGPNLLWARLGSVLLFSLTALLSFKILNVYFDKLKVFWAVFATAFFISAANLLSLIHYFTFPAFLVTLFVFFFNQVLVLPIERTSFKVYSFLFGFITIPIVLSRFPLVLMIFISVPVFLYSKVTQKEITELNKSTPYVILGTAISCGIFFLLYKSIGFLDIYINTLADFGTGQKKSQNYSLLPLIASYLREFGRVFVYASIAVMGLCIVSLLKRHWSNRIVYPILLILALAPLLLTFNIFEYQMMVIKAVIGIILLVSAIFFWQDKGENRNLSLLVLVNSFIMLVTPLGSGAGIYKSIYGMWLALPLILLLTYQIAGKAAQRRFSTVLSLNTAVIGLLIFTSLIFHILVYGEALRFSLSTNFKHPSLWGIYSQKERVTQVDEVLSEINRLTEKDDPVIMINHIPMFYYLTQTKPVFGFGYSWLFLEDLPEVKRLTERAIEKRDYPKLIVYAKTNTYQFNWPNESPGNIRPKERAKQEYFKWKYISELGYDKTWENASFTIYSRPSGLEMEDITFTSKSKI